MSAFRIRCSSLASIMTDPTTKAARDAGELSEGAKTHVADLVRQTLYGYRQSELGSKEIRKGRAMEGGAIRLLSDFTGEFYSKNEERISNDYLTGEADIVAADHGVDTKVPWSIEQFPIVESIARKAAIKAGYEWQVRGYMHLYDKPRWAVSYVLMPTPTDLMSPWESSEIHDIPLFAPIERRVTMVWFERDKELEEKIVQKCKAAQAYAEELIKQFDREKSA